MAYQYRETSNVKVELVNVYAQADNIQTLQSIAKWQGISRSKLLSLYLKGGGKYEYITKQVQKRNKKILLRNKHTKAVKKAMQKKESSSKCLPYFTDCSTHRMLSM